MIILLFVRLPWEQAVIAASLVIVTGPTVIAPLLKRIRVKDRLHSILSWEAVLIDPIGITTERYFDSVLEQTPMNFLVDPSGKIVFKETGTPAADLPQRIDQMLPAQ